MGRSSRELAHVCFQPIRSLPTRSRDISVVWTDVCAHAALSAMETRSLRWPPRDRQPCGNDTAVAYSKLLDEGDGGPQAVDRLVRGLRKKHEELGEKAASIQTLLEDTDRLFSGRRQPIDRDIAAFEEQRAMIVQRLETSLSAQSETSAPPQGPKLGVFQGAAHGHHDRIGNPLGWAPEVVFNLCGSRGGWVGVGQGRAGRCRAKGGWCAIAFGCRRRCP